MFEDLKKNLNNGTSRDHRDFWDELIFTEKLNFLYGLKDTSKMGQSRIILDGLSSEAKASLRNVLGDIMLEFSPLKRTEHWGIFPEILNIASRNGFASLADQTFGEMLGLLDGDSKALSLKLASVYQALFTLSKENERAVAFFTGILENLEYSDFHISAFNSLFYASPGKSDKLLNRYFVPMLETRGMNFEDFLHHLVRFKIFEILSANEFRGVDKVCYERFVAETDNISHQDLPDSVRAWRNELPANPTTPDNAAAEVQTQSQQQPRIQNEEVCQAVYDVTMNTKSKRPRPKTQSRHKGYQIRFRTSSLDQTTNAKAGAQ